MKYRFRITGTRPFRLNAERLYHPGVYRVPEDLPEDVADRAIAGGRGHILPETKAEGPAPQNKALGPATENKRGGRRGRKSSRQ